MRYMIAGFKNIIRAFEAGAIPKDTTLGIEFSPARLDHNLPPGALGERLKMFIKVSERQGQVEWLVTRYPLYTNMWTYRERMRNNGYRDLTAKWEG